jgi:single-strand DNA-binding protein
MANINSVTLVGNLTRDAELKYTSGGAAIVKFALAVNRRKKVGETWQDEAHFFDIAMMGKSAESVHKFLTKGKQVGVQGELRQERWEQEGQARTRVSVFAFTVQLLGGPAGEQSGKKPDESDDDIPW